MTTCTQLNQFEDACPMDCGRTAGDCPFSAVVIPAELGTDAEGELYAPANGAYQNAIVRYEANGHIYIYSSDGIPFYIVESNSPVSSVNGRTGAVVITLNELGGLTSTEINTLIAGKGYQTAEQVETTITGKGYQTAAQVNTIVVAKGYQTASQVESAITSKGYQTASQVDSKIATAKTEIEAEIPDVIDNTSSTSTTDALSANQGNVLNTRIDNIESRGRYLSTWDATTGLPGTNPTTLPYTYKTGDYFIVSAIADGYRHSLSLAGSTTSLGIYEGTYEVAFVVENQSSTELTTVADIVAEMDDDERYSATGTLHVTGGSDITITSVIKWVEQSVTYIALCPADEQKAALVLTATTCTDVVTGGTTNYKPNGATYTGAASSTTESGSVYVNDTYLYDGTSWTLIHTDVPSIAIDDELSSTSRNPVENRIITGALDDKADASTTYTKTEVDTALSAKADQSTTYTKTEVDTALSAKANQSTTYTKTEVDAELADKADAATTYTKTEVDTALATKQGTLTPGSNITILSDTISATDTTYSPFTGATSSAAGTSGLVPAPTTADVDKFLKGDGTWGAAGGGGGDAVYSTKTTSNNNNYGGAVYIGGKNSSQVVYEDPTTTDNHYRYFWALPWQGSFTPANNSVNIMGQRAGTNTILIAADPYGAATGANSVVIGSTSNNNVGGSSVAIGYGASSNVNYVVSIGQGANASAQQFSVAIGAWSSATQKGEVSFGADGSNSFYNNTPYRLLTHVYDGQSAHDAATLAQANTLGSAAPTTSTVGVLGQLYTDTSTGTLYHCTAISGSTYTWEAVGGGGAWGSITGTLSDQTDLQDALDDKQDLVTISNHTLYL